MKIVELVLKLLTLTLISCSSHNLKKNIDELHKKTGFLTYYDFFNISEFATQKQIEDSFRQLITSKNPFPNLELSKQEVKSLATKGYNLLKRKRDEYDRALNSKDFYNQPEVPGTLKMAMFFVSCVLFVVFLDVLNGINIFVSKGFKGGFLENMKIVKFKRKFF